MLLFTLYQVEDYHGGRGLEDLLAYVNKMSAKEPSADKLSTDGKVPDDKESDKQEAAKKVTEKKDEKKVFKSCANFCYFFIKMYQLKLSHLRLFFYPATYTPHTIVAGYYGFTLDVRVSVCCTSVSPFLVSR